MHFSVAFVTSAHTSLQCIPEYAFLLPAAAVRLAGPRCIVALASGLRLSGCGVSSAGRPGSSAAAAAAGLQELLLEEVDDLGEQVSSLAVPGSAT